MKLKGEYMGKEEEMILEVVEKDQNRKLVTRQREGPFKHWESIQEFNGGKGASSTADAGNNNSSSGKNRTRVTHVIEYELPTTGKVASMLTGNDANAKIRQGLEQAAQTVKQRLESGPV